MLLLLSLLLLTCQQAPCRRWLCLFNFRKELESDASERGQDKEERGKEREGDFLGPEKEGEISQNDP